MGHLTRPAEEDFVDNIEPIAVPRNANGVEDVDDGFRGLPAKLDRII